MSFALTPGKILDRSKTVTRRFGWLDLKPGGMVRAVEKAQGLKRGEHPKQLAVLFILSVTREPLNDLIRYDGWAEARMEGFEGYAPWQFVEIYCLLNHCQPDTMVTRIEFEYVEEEGKDAGRTAR